MNNSKELIRLFVSVDMPPTVIQEVLRIQDVLKKHNLFIGRYIKPEHMHITIKFIGEVVSDTVPLITNALRSITFEQLRAQLDRLDIFFKRSFIRIIFLNLICPGLIKLVDQVANVLAPWVEPEERDFVTHLTIARVKKVEDSERLIQAISTIQVNPISFTINSFMLKQSILTPEGPEYITIKEYEV